MVLVAQRNKCPFAVRSGGHAAFARASSANEGITVVLERMAAVTLSEDKKMASIGAGALWGNIYTSLAKHNLTVVGGRERQIQLVVDPQLAFPSSPTHGAGHVTMLRLTRWSSRMDAL